MLFVGRLVPEKRPELALAAAAQAGVAITFLGDGPLRAALAREAQRLGAIATFAGFQPIPWPTYARHRVLMLTSQYETFANVIVESLAAGTPVVSVDCDFGPREILAGARFSSVVADRASALAHALREVTECPPDAAEHAECRAIAERY